MSARRDDPYFGVAWDGKEPAAPAAGAKPSLALVEPEVEAAVLGCLLSYPDALAATAAELRVEWFGDVAGSLVAGALLKLNAEGHKPSAAALAAALPATLDGNGLTRSSFISGVMAQGVPLSQLSGCLATLRDRWARRRLLAQVDVLQLAANDATVSPFDTAAALIAETDAITVSRSEVAAGSLGAGIDQLFEGYHSPRRRSATTGIRSLDAALNGYAAGKLYVLAGRPGMGKSAFACSSLRSTAEAGHGVALFSLEMGADEIAARCLSDAIGDVAGPFFGNIIRGQFSQADDDALVTARSRLHDIPLHVDASTGLNFSQIAARSRRRKAALEARGLTLDVVAIDHMGLIEAGDRYRGNKVAEAGEISRAAKFLAKELDCCVMLLCQLNRGVEGREDKRPVLADLRWSGDIEQDADVVAFLFREAYYVGQRPDADPAEYDRVRNRLEFLIRKNRNGETREIPLWCSIGHSAIREAA